MTPRNYDKDFVRNTINLLNNNFDYFKNKNLEVTFLINCLTGLIVTTYEKIGKTKSTIFNSTLEELSINKVPTKRAYLDLNSATIKLKKQIAQQGLLNISHNPTIEFQISNCSDMKLIDVLNKIRNGIAHQHIKPIDSRDYWRAILIWNMKGDLKNFEIIFTVQELKDFSIFIAEEYLKM